MDMLLRMARSFLERRKSYEGSDGEDLRVARGGGKIGESYGSAWVIFLCVYHDGQLTSQQKFRR